MPAVTTTTPPPANDAPKITGVTTKDRAARQAEQREPSDATLSMMPGASDLARELGIKSPKYAAAQPPGEADAEDGDDEEGEEKQPGDDQPEDEESPEGESEAEAESSADADTEEEKAESTEEEETASDDEEEENLPPEALKIRDAMQKRIDKLTAKHTGALEELEDLRGQLAEVQAGPRPQRSAADPLADVLNERELEGAIAEARQMKRWATLNRDGGELPTGKDGETQSFDAKEVAVILANAEAVLDAAPTRRDWLDKQAHAETVARQVAPAFFEKGSTHQQVLDKVWAETPAAVKAWRPDAKLMIIQMLVGAAVMHESQAKKAPANTEGAKPQVSVKKVPPAPGGKVAPKASTKVVDARNRKEQLKKVTTGGHRQLTAAIADRLNF